MSEKLSEKRSVSSVVEAQQLVRAIAAPAQIGDTIKRQLDRAARRIPFWRYSRVKDVWYADSRVRIDHEELLALQKIARANEAAREARTEYRALLDRIAKIETALCVRDAIESSEEADEGRGLAGAADCTLD